MKGTIANFRQGRHHQYDNHLIVSVEGVKTRDKAATLIGKEVVFTTPSGKTITGTIKAAHGNKGAVRIIFERGLPGQAFGQKVEVKA